MFYIDQSILTFHSPEIDFEESLSNMGSSDLKLRIVGVSPVTGTTSDLSILSNTPALSKGSTGVYDKSPSILNLSRIGARGLSTGVNYIDYPYRSDFTPSDNPPEAGFPVYPWHRNGSLGNQGVLKTDESRYGGLDKKKMSNLRYSYNSLYYTQDNIWLPSNGVSDV